MKTLFAVSVIASLAAVGCASTGQGLPGRDGHSPGGVRPPGIPTTEDVEGGTGMPERISAVELPAVDKLSRKIVHEHRGVISAQVRLCVAPDGAVAGVEVVEPSGMVEYDQAVVTHPGREDINCDREERPDRLRPGGGDAVAGGNDVVIR